jgi:dTDP-4-dehydrorhamnose 3,5-epimerase-like enzyme
MKIKELKMKAVFEITLEPSQDHRGFFMRTYDDQIFKKLWNNKRCQRTRRS